MTVSPVKTGSWILRRPDDESRGRLFCFPYSGVGASMYAKWPTHLGPDEVCAVQLPGRENRTREPHFGTYEQMAEAAADALAPYLDRPFAFFGHCGGALAAFAVALRLAERGLPTPACLFVSSQVAPHDGPFGRYLGLSDLELAVELGELAAAMGGRPTADLIEAGMKVLRADLDANRRYVFPEPVRLPGALHALGWHDDAEIRPEQMTGWSEYAVPGSHRFQVLDGPHHAFLGAPPQLLTALAEGMAAAFGS